MNKIITLLLMLTVMLGESFALENKTLDAAISGLQRGMASRELRDFVAVLDPDSAHARALERLGDKGWGNWEYDLTITLDNREELFTDKTISIARVLAKETATKTGNPESVLGINTSTRILIFRIKDGKYMLYEMTPYDLSSVTK